MKEFTNQELLSLAETMCWILLPGMFLQSIFGVLFFSTLYARDALWLEKEKARMKTKERERKGAGEGTSARVASAL